MTKFTRIPLGKQSQVEERESTLGELLGEQGTLPSKTQECTSWGHRSHALNLDTAVAVLPADILLIHYSDGEGL